jgi:hypothetical protein
VGKGNLRVLAVMSPDPILSAIGPLALGAASGTALVVDMVGGLSVKEGRTLAQIADEGPRLVEIAPGRTGVAVIESGHISVDDAERLVRRLSESWPAVVVRCLQSQWPGPTVPVRALYPGRLAPTQPIAAVWQPISLGSRPPGPGLVLPRLGRRTITALLSGRLPFRDRWVSSWRGVWDLPWA